MPDPSIQVFFLQQSHYQVSQKMKKKLAVSKGSFISSTGRIFFPLSVFRVTSWKTIVCVASKKDLGSWDIVQDRGDKLYTM